MFSSAALRLHLLAGRKAHSIEDNPTLCQLLLRHYLAQHRRLGTWRWARWRSTMMHLLEKLPIKINEKNLEFLTSQGESERKR